MYSCLALDYILEFDRGARRGHCKDFHAVPSGAFLRDRYRRVLDIAVFLSSSRPIAASIFRLVSLAFFPSFKGKPHPSAGSCGIDPLGEITICQRRVPRSLRPAHVTPEDHVGQTGGVFHLKTSWNQCVCENSCTV